ncbi:MAG TPA: FecR family protein [Pyrinomonadaceae bacterium]|nr:FecR family protein [Pyrinomonadaceae bacterium]
MKRSFFQMFTVFAAGLVLASFSFGQQKVTYSATADKYTISAKAGGVNFIEGDVTVARKEGRSGVLLRRDQLETGDRVSTGANGKAEILLNPGSYIRLGSNSSFHFLTTSLDDLKIRVDSGTAMFEVFAANEFQVIVETPTGSLALIETGVYKVDVPQNGFATVAVFEGKAQLADPSLTLIKKGRTGVIGSTTAAVTKFDRDNRGDLGDWSKSRSKDLAKMTSSLQERDVRDSLISSFDIGRWSMFDSFGLWVFNPRSMSYCFLPFGYGWRSPYGFGLGGGFFWYNLPWYITSPPVAVADPNRKDPRNTGRGGIIRNEELPFKVIERKRQPRIENDPGDFDIRRPVRNDRPIIAPLPTDKINTDRKKDN